MRKADALILMCPNYNDALSANLTAFINRLTALFRQTRFYDKAVFALVVSGYSGSDTVARQLISALNMNKSFYLPPRFALLETANAPGEGPGRPRYSQSGWTTLSRGWRPYTDSFPKSKLVRLLSRRTGLFSRPQTELGHGLCQGGIYWS